MPKKRMPKIFEQIKITDAGAKGKAIGHAPDGRVVFVANAIPGDLADVQIFKKRKNYYEGRAIHFHELSTDRVKPLCTHFGECGGCKWQHMAYQTQLHYKQKEVSENLQRIGSITPQETLPILEANSIFFYRNKMEYSFSDARWITNTEVETGTTISNKNALGFHKPGMWDKVLQIDQCHLQTEPGNTIRNFIKQEAERLNIPFFNPRQQTGMLRTLLIRISSTGQIMVLLQFFYEDKHLQDSLLEAIAKKFPEIQALLYTINNKGNDTLYDLNIQTYYGKSYIEETMEGLKFRVNAKSFYQTNSAQAYTLYKVVRQFAALSGQERVYDLYTGTGTIALFLASKASHIIGVEAVPDAITAAKENAHNNNIKNTTFIVGDMKKVFTDKFIQENGFPDVVVTDPPRDGMHADVVNQLLKIKPKKIVYVSCNSATQARDIALLKTHYKLTKSQAVDMFPHTHHIENVVLLELNNIQANAV